MQRQNVVRNSAIISLFNGTGVVSSLVLDIVIAAFFGVGRETDAFFVASTIPLLVYVVLRRAGEVALVPIFSDYRTRYGQAHTEKLFSILLNLALGAFVLLALLGVAGSWLLVRLVGPGLSASEMQLAASLGQVMFLSMALTGPLSVVIAFLTARYAFAATASTELVRNVMAMAVLLLFGARLGILSVAAGYVVGSVGQFVAVLLALRGQRVGYRFSWDLRFPGVRESLQALSWPIVSQLARQSVEIVERVLASYLPAGSISALKYARRIISALINVLLNSVSSASLPLLSDHWSEKKVEAFKRTLASGLKLVVAIGMPLCVALYVLRTPLIQLLFKRGMVTQASVTLIAQLLGLYALGVPFLGSMRMLLSPHYSVHDTRTPAIHLILTTVVNIVLDVIFFRWRAAEGIALATSITGVFSALRAGWLARRQSGPFVGNIGLFLVKLSAAAAVMGGAIYLCRVWVERRGFLPSTVLALVLELLFAGLVGLISLMGVAYILRVHEIWDAFAGLIRLLPSWWTKGGQGLGGGRV